MDKLTLSERDICTKSGWLVVAAVGAGVGAWLLISVHAPSGDMVDWEATPPTWHRWNAWARGAWRGGRAREEGDQ